jgi:hypothetical protein
VSTISIACQLSREGLHSAVKMNWVSSAFTCAERHFHPALMGRDLEYIGACRGGRSSVDHVVSVI